MAVIDHIDATSRIVYLSASTVDTTVQPIEIYQEMRALRRIDEVLRGHDLFLTMKGAEKKNPDGSKRTERYMVLLDGTLIVPYDGVSHFITIDGTIITDSGLEGVDCFDRSSMPAGVEVDINYVPKQVEVITVNTGGSALTQEEHDKLIGVPDAADNAAAVWSYITRDLTQAEFDSNIIKVNGVTVTDINDFKADVSNLSADVNVIEVNGVIVNSVDDFKADLTGIDLSTDVNVIEVNGTAVTSVDDFKADLTEIDLSTIPAAVWAYVSRELTVAAGLTPAQEAKLDAVPTAAENAEAIAGYTRP